MKNTKKISLLASLFAVAIVLMSFVIKQGGGWVVPEAEAAKKNPVEASAASIEAGKAVYTKHCKMCHGVTGEGGKMAGTSNFKSPEFQAQTDGAIYYKNDVGYGKMPSYKTKIADETDKWNLVNYMRTLK